MRVALDAQLAVGTSTGIGEYARGLAVALRAAGADVVALENPSLDPWRFDRRVFWDQVLLPLAARRARADLLHCASGTMPLVRPCPTVVTVHDVAWLRVQEHTRAYARAYFGRFALQQYAHARRALVDSHFSKRELADVSAIDPGRIDVVYPGVAADVAAILRRPDDVPFILVAATLERRKNLEVVIRALAALPNVRLVSTGPTTAYRAECERLAESLSIADRIEFRGYVPRNELLDLYARAAVAAVPSTYEGFGYSAAWALCAGVPLIVADSSSLPEVAGDAAPHLPAHDAGAWTETLKSILADREGAEARAAGVRAAASERFGWAGAARAAAQSYLLALEG